MMSIEAGVFSALVIADSKEKWNDKVTDSDPFVVKGIADVHQLGFPGSWISDFGLETAIFLSCFLPGIRVASPSCTSHRIE